MAKGILTQNGVHLQEHEYATVKLLLENGYNVELVPTSQIKGMRTPDLVINGITWEMKSPTGSGRHTIKHTLQNASHQSVSVIVDLRRCGIPEDKAVKELEQGFQLSRRFRRMKIVLKSGELLDYQK